MSAPDSARIRADQTIPEGWPEPLHGWARYRHLYRLFREEGEAPEPFYRYLASESLAWLADKGCEVEGARILDLGSGPGHYASALAAAGGDVIEVEYDTSELTGSRIGDLVGGRIVTGDAAMLPIADASVDAIFSSNMLEHVAAGPLRVLTEAERVMRPGGWFYLSFTNWYSPWGGHAISPFHYLGPRIGLALFRRVHGEPVKNVPGVGLFPVHIGQVVRLVRDRTDFAVRAMVPRYYPDLSFICRIRGLREILAWNCLLLLEKPARHE